MELFSLLGLLVFCLILIALLESENNSIAIGITVAVLLSYTAYHGFIPTFNWIYNNIGIIIIGIITHIVLGIGWSFFKWDRFCAKAAQSWKSVGAKEGSKSSYMPVWSKNKAKLTCWVVWWPFSVIGYILGDLLIDMFNYIFKQFGEVYNKLSNRHFTVGEK